MTRVWTVGELDRVHPLPDGWVWGYSTSEGRQTVVACHDASAVWVDGLGELCSETPTGNDYPDDTAPVDPPATVALAVILAHKGLDSNEEIIRELEDREEALIHESIAFAKAGLIEKSYQAAGRAEGLRDAAAMLRRGTVAP